MILDSKTSQLVKIDDDVYIFKGSNPDNYVRFNCDSNNNCETWRIIGLYVNNIKIQNTVSIGKKIIIIHGKMMVHGKIVVYKTI